MNQARKTLFIADLHLDKRYPKALQVFQQYIEQLNEQHIDAIYILGDLFEYWLGDDCCDQTAQIIADTLSDYQEKSAVPIFFTHGNRDFLLGRHYAQRCRMKILPAVKEINLYGIKTLILHGDTLCTDDIDYQQFREVVRTPQWQRKILKLPVWLRRVKAWQMRNQSKKANAAKATEIMDVSQPTVNAIMQEHQATQMIHGHTHRPAIHEWQIKEKTYKRLVVGDWYTQGSVLEVTESGHTLITLSSTT